ncbi:PAS domain-containing protein [Kitasatospora sp. NPDC008050]|uniref:PAS domain-containing protein n=1 Tax=Kitasatospora sp. NPDC008050 TaxID=3364021 RepID=UPI0036EB5590
MSLPLTSAPPAPTTAAVEWDLLRDTVRWEADAYQVLARDPGLGPLTLDQLPGQLVPQDRPALCRMVTAALVHGRPLDGVVRLLTPGGQDAAVHCSGRPVLGPDGQVVSLRMLLRTAD